MNSELKRRLKLAQKAAEKEKKAAEQVATNPKGTAAAVVNDEDIDPNVGLFSIY